MEYCPILGLPDIELVGEQDRVVNPRDFAGHELLVLFCPADVKAAKRELEEYNSLTDALAFNDAYMIAICDPKVGAPGSRVTLATDSQGSAWSAFGECLPSSERSAGANGAAFLMGRGGCLKQSWVGVGHVDEVRKALGTRM